MLPFFVFSRTSSRGQNKPKGEPKGKLGNIILLNYFNRSLRYRQRKKQKAIEKLAKSAQYKHVNTTGLNLLGLATYGESRVKYVNCYQNHLAKRYIVLKHLWDQLYNLQGKELY